MRIRYWSSDWCSSDLHDLERAAGADQSRQVVADAALAGAEPDLHCADEKVRRWRSDADVGGQRDAEAGTDRSAMHRCDNRLRQASQAQDRARDKQIGRESCSETGCQSVYISVVTVSLKKKIKTTKRVKIDRKEK